MNKHGDFQIVATPSWYDSALQRVDIRITQADPQRTESLLSPCGRFTLTIDWYETDGFTSYYDSRVTQGDRLICGIKGECLRFWHAWLEVGGKVLLLPYLPACQILVNCESGKRFVILDAEDAESPPFRWLAVKQHPSGNPILAIEGRYDGSPCRLKIVDFGDVQKPRCLRYLDAWYSEFDGWVSDDAIRITRNVEVRSSDNRKLEDMTDEELEQHEVSGDPSHDVDGQLDIDVSEVWSPTWTPHERNPLILTTEL